MAGEFLVNWKDENDAAYAINAANLSYISPHLLYFGKQFISPIEGQRNKLIISGETAIKIIVGGEHRMFKINNDLVFTPVDLLDAGTTLDPGTDYHIYCVANADSGSLVVSKNATFPVGATADNSRRIGGFHTLCADVGTLQESTHPLYGFMARDILPQSAWDLLNRPKTCEPMGMVLDPSTKTWLDIYMQSGTGVNTKSVYQGTVTKSRSWDMHQEDLAYVGKRMLTDQEFTSAAWGTIPYRAVMGAVDPITTGGKVNTDGRRIISNIGCEDMAGCYWQWIGHVGCSGGSSYADAAGQGQQYQTIYAMLAGGDWDSASSSGARARAAVNARSAVYANDGSRGCADGLSVI